jgi:hypothetical protein
MTEWDWPTPKTPLGGKNENLGAKTLSDAAKL